MKRIFVFAAIASIALASCQKNEVITASNDSQKEISVLAFNDVRTKGYTGWTTGQTAFEEVANPSADPIGEATARDLILSAYDKTMGLDYFTGKTFAKAADGKWKCTPAVYYPIGGDELEFLAYSIGKVGTPCSINPIWNDARNLTIQVSSATDDDILYGAATSTAKTQPTDGVAMEFQHAQAWLTVKLTSNIEKPASGTDGDILKVKSITWENIYSSGELNIAYGTTPTATWNFFTQSPSDFEMTDDNNVKGSFVYKKPAAGDLPPTQILDMLVPAQPAQNFIITYELGGKEFTYEVTKANFANAILNDGFKAGSHYTFNVDFTVKEITIAPTVKVFEDVTGFDPDPLEI